MKATSKNDQQWLDHCAEMKRLHDVKASELVAAGWRKSGPSRTPRFSKNGQTVELRRQLGSNVWYTVEV